MHELLVTQLVEHYQLNDPQLVHLGTVWNTTYRITELDGACYNLRLCNPRFQDQSSLLAELAFVAFITKHHQLCVPQPIANRKGELVTPTTTSDGQQLCCLFSWIEGHEARGRLSSSIMEQIGRSMAMLHVAAQAYPFPTPGDGFREGYCYDEVLVQAHREWIAHHAAALGSERVTLLYAAVEHVLSALAAVGKNRATYGVIHADLHPGNFIVDGDAVAVIDFDQVGRGHFCYDIALLMVELLREEPRHFSAYWKSFTVGYQEVAPLPYTEEQALEPFALGIDLVFLDAYYNSWTPEGRAQYGHRLDATYESIRHRLEQQQTKRQT
jgi:Ser/Thr protein kinase RdoA (MazF antagonist)